MEGKEQGLSQPLACALYNALKKGTIFISCHRIIDFSPKAITIEKMLKYQSSTYRYFCWYSHNVLRKSMHFGASTYFLRLTARTMTKTSLNSPLVSARDRAHI